MKIEVNYSQLMSITTSIETAIRYEQRVLAETEESSREEIAKNRIERYNKIYYQLDNIRRNYTDMDKHVMLYTLKG